jgi:hypothetical protein
MLRVDGLFVAMHELLWLPLSVDYGRLAHLTDVLTADGDRFFESVSLNVLLTVRKPEGILPTAGEFYGLCEHFAAAVGGQAPLEDLQQDYEYLIACWPELSAYFQRCSDQDVLANLAEIESSFVTIRDTLDMKPNLEWRQLDDLIAATRVLSERLDADIRQQIVANRRYPPRFRTEAEQLAGAYRDAVERISDAVARRNIDETRQAVVDLAEQWQRLHAGCLARLPAQNRIRFEASAERLAPRIVDLQTRLQL